MVKIISAQYDEAGGIVVVFEGQKPDTFIVIPPDELNKDYVKLQEWVAEGGEIRAYEAPPPPPPQPTIEDLIDVLMARIAELEKRIP